jgi:hypothetical protein
MNSKQVGPLLGILFVVLVAISFAVSGETPSVDDPPRDIVKFYLDNDSSQQLAATLLGLACVPFLFFLGSLRRALRSAPGDGGVLSTVMLIGGLVMAVGLSIFAAITFTLGDAVDHLPVSAVLTLNAMNSDFFFPGAVGVAAFNLALAVAILSHGGLPRPLGWAALVVGIAAVTPAGFFAFLATGIIVIWASIALYQRVDDGEPPQTAAPSQGAPL